MTGIVIVGAGHAGVQLAASLRENGYEKTINLISAEKDIPYHKPPLSKSHMQTPEARLQPLRAEVFYEENQIDLILGRRVIKIDPDTQNIYFENDEKLGFDKLVLATGSKARLLNSPNAHCEGIFTLRTLEDATHIRKYMPKAQSTIVIGGGFIGLEMAAMLSAKGMRIRVLEADTNILGRVISSEMSARIHKQLETMGVQISTDCKIEEFQVEQNMLKGVRLVSGEALPVDMAIVGIGADPEVELAYRAGLNIDNGICVDAYLQTSREHIYAIGDCCSFMEVKNQKSIRLESVQNACDQAKMLAKTITGVPTIYQSVPWFWSDIGPMKLQIAGLNDGFDEKIIHENNGIKAVFYLKDKQLIAVETLNQPGMHMLARRLLEKNITPTQLSMQTLDIPAIKNML